MPQVEHRRVQVVNMGFVLYGFVPVIVGRAMTEAAFHTAASGAIAVVNSAERFRRPGFAR